MMGKPKKPKVRPWSRAIVKTFEGKKGIEIAPGEAVNFDEVLYLYPGDEVHVRRAIENGRRMVYVIVNGVLRRTVSAPMPRPRLIVAPQLLPPDPPALEPPSAPPPAPVAVAAPSAPAVQVHWLLGIIFALLCHLRLHAWRLHRRLLEHPDPGKEGPPQLVSSTEKCARCARERVIGSAQRHRTMEPA